jgi:hypothetical protein
MTFGNASGWPVWNPQNSKTEDPENSNGPESFKGSISEHQPLKVKDVQARLDKILTDKYDEYQTRKIADNEKLKKDLIGKETNYPYSKEHEKILINNKLEQKKNTLGGQCGNTSLIKLKDDGFAVFKPYDQEGRYRVEERREQIQNERAAYLIDLFLGLELVPPTVMRALPEMDADNPKMEQVGSIQQFIEDARVGKELTEEEKNKVPKDEVMKLTLFDYMLQNTDRHDENYLVKNNKLYAIDHGLCLGTEIHSIGSSRASIILSTDGLNISSGLINREDFWTTPLAPTDVSKMKSFTSSQKEQLLFKQLLTELIGDHRASVFQRRINCIIESIDENNILDRETLETKTAAQLYIYTKEQEEMQTVA